VAQLNGSRLAVQVACTAGGRADLSVPAMGASTLAQSTYKCSRGRSTVKLSLTPASAQRIVRSGSVLARLSLKQGSLTQRLSLALGPRAAGTSVWTSVFGLRCGAAGSYQAQLLAPNFSSQPTATTIDVRPWLASCTSKQAGTVNPWTWAPIRVSPGHGTYVVAVFEAIYWYSHPSYVWQNARSGPDANTIVPYCAYP
jgi:hypothetical protein